MFVSCLAPPEKKSWDKLQALRSARGLTTFRLRCNDASSTSSTHTLHSQAGHWSESKTNQTERKSHVDVNYKSHCFKCLADKTNPNAMWCDSISWSWWKIDFETAILRNNNERQIYENILRNLFRIITERNINFRSHRSEKNHRDDVFKMHLCVERIYLCQSLSSRRPLHCISQSTRVHRRVS